MCIYIYIPIYIHIYLCVYIHIYIYVFDMCLKSADCSGGALQLLEAMACSRPACDAFSALSCVKFRSLFLYGLCC